MLAIPGTIGKAPSSTTVDLDVSGVVAVTVFVRSAAALLTALARVLPANRAVTGVPGVSLCLTGRSGRPCVVPDRLPSNGPSHHQDGCDLRPLRTLTGRPVGVAASQVATAPATYFGPRATVGSARSPLWRATRSAVFRTLLQRCEELQCCPLS